MGPHTSVVLVQPNADEREMYAEYLEHYGVPTVAVGSAEEALAVAPDAAVIVTGILLSGNIDGIELMQRLRTDTRTTRTPIIVLTALVQPTYYARAKKAGCDVFLGKPCLPDDLLREIRRVEPQR
jgi:two-component system cell cycle response regulator DivK